MILKGGLPTSLKVKGGHSYRETLADFLFDSGALSLLGGAKRWRNMFFILFRFGYECITFPLNEWIDKLLLVGNEESEILCGIKYERLPTFAIVMVALGIAHRSAFNKMRYQARSNWCNDVEFVKSGNKSSDVDTSNKGLAETDGTNVTKRKRKDEIWGRSMAGYLEVDSEGRKGGLAIMWKDGIEVTIQNNCSHHIDSLVKLDDSTSLRFTGFYRFAKLNLHGHSWDLLKSIGESVSEYWIVGGDFNAILNDSKKSEGRRKSRVDMEDFQRTIEELALVDIKIVKRWFMWTNNREGNGLIRERLDRFLFSATGVENTPFLSTYVVRQACSDHDAVILDTLGHKPRDEMKDPRLLFKFEASWAHEKKAKYFIKRA
ncbi:hypothetical protein Gohar_013636 [Gossypium harknessii]|uniref:Endonuclease/exonuclease/phosphatase domain-containing protein n=1 Tax=Gossypium harknessii TaxID=34285 RepID=A0A7J9H0Q9_9ROSI|nr:hypothetical protein [Gossypium harknessii]